MLGRVNRVPCAARPSLLGSRISGGRSGCPLRRLAMMKSATAIAVATTVMKAGNSSKNSTGYGKAGGNSTTSVMQY
jgi:hypothetical protein